MVKRILTFLNKEFNGVNEAALLLGGFAFLSQLLGLVRERLLAQYVGVGSSLDVYNASFRIPDLILGIMLSFAAASTVVPFITKAIQNNDTKDLDERFNSILFFYRK